MLDTGKNNNKSLISYKELILFFLPLAITPILIGFTHIIINASLARLASPALSIAIYSVVKNLSNIMRAPIMMSGQTIISLVNNKNDYQVTKKVIWSTGFLITILLFLLAFTPLGGWFFKNVMGLKDSKQILYAYYALKISCFLPLVELLRNISQGLAIANKKTNLVIPGILLRLISISIFLWFAVKKQLLLGIIAGSLAWVVGIGLEGAFIFISLFYYFNSPADAAERIESKSHGKLTKVDVLKFFGPLGLMMILTKFLQPLIQGGIARTENSTVSLAAYGIAWTLVFLLLGPLRMINQCVLVYVKKLNSPEWFRILKFCIMTGFLTSTILLFIALTPVGFWLLHRVIALSIEITQIVQKTLLAMAVFPVFRSIREAYCGLLMKCRNTSIIGWFKLINIFMTFIFLTCGFLLFDLEPAVIGALAFSTGEMVESLVIWYYTSLKLKTVNNMIF